MAKKIILAFNSALESGAGSNFGYQIQISGLNLTYNSGLDIVDIGYNTTGDVFPDEIKILGSLDENIIKTLSWLNVNYSSSIITYSRLENTIEVYIDSESAIVSGVFSNNVGLVISVENINVIVEGEIKLKYFFQYKNVVNDDYRFEIYEVGFTGNSSEVIGRATIEKGPSKDHLEPVRGTSVSISLEATIAQPFEDLYSENELSFPVKFYRNNVLIFRGFLNPDGVFFSFTDEIWNINLDCVDGLGAIDNLSFVTESGLHFTGLMSIQDIIFNCLRRTGMLQKINTSVNIFYDGYEDLPNRNIFDAAEANTDRYVKKDDNTIMSCGNILRSMLDIFNAVITQFDGEWYIYRPNEIYQNSYVEFKKYNISNAYEATFTKNLNVRLGSHINDVYPRHCNRDQKIRIKGSISAFRINYKYGFLTSSIPNSNLAHDNLLNYPDWTKYPMSNAEIINDPTRPTGIFIKSNNYDMPTEKIMSSSNLFLVAESTFQLKADLTVYGYLTAFYFKVRLGSYYLQNDGSWTTDDNLIKHIFGSSAPDAQNFPEVEDTFIFSSMPTPVAGSVFVEIWVPENRLSPFATELRPSTWIRSVNILVNTGETSNREGEFHTVERAKVSSNVRDNKEVSNGDSIDTYYAGALFKTGGAELTETWHRKNFVESKTLLQISAEDALRLSQIPLKTFTGSFMGYIPYLSIISIDNLPGKYMAIEYFYDTFTNMGRHKLLQLYSNELPDITYKFTYDYGNVVKPTIKG